MLRRLQRRLLTTTPISEVSRPRSLLSRLLLHTPPPPEEIDLKALKSHHPHILKLTPELLEKTAVCIYNNSSNSLRSYSYAKLLSDSLATRAHSILNLKNDCKTASSTTTTACDLHGEKKPKRIALLAPPSYEFLVAKWATWLGGDCLVPLCK